MTDKKKIHGARREIMMQYLRSKWRQFMQLKIAIHQQQKEHTA